VSKNLAEPSIQRFISGQGYNISQLLRRPAPSMEKTVEIKVFADDEVLTIGDTKIVFFVSDDLNNHVLVDADACVFVVSSSGDPEIQVRNVTSGNDMLSTPITIDQGERCSYGAATQPVIDTANDDVATGDPIAIDVDVAGADATGLAVILTFA